MSFHLQFGLLLTALLTFGCGDNSTNEVPATALSPETQTKLEERVSLIANDGEHVACKFEEGNRWTEYLRAFDRIADLVSPETSTALSQADRDVLETLNAEGFEAEVSKEDRARCLAAPQVREAIDLLCRAQQLDAACFTCAERESELNLESWPAYPVSLSGTLLRLACSGLEQPGPSDSLDEFVFAWHSLAFDISYVSGWPEFSSAMQLVYVSGLEFVFDREALSPVLDSFSRARTRFPIGGSQLWANFESNLDEFFTSALNQVPPNYEHSKPNRKRAIATPEDVTFMLEFEPELKADLLGDLCAARAVMKELDSKSKTCGEALHRILGLPVSSYRALMQGESTLRAYEFASNYRDGKHEELRRLGPCEEKFQIVRGGGMLTVKRIDWEPELGRFDLEVSMQD